MVKANLREILTGKLKVGEKRTFGEMEEGDLNLIDKRICTRK